MCVELKRMVSELSDYVNVCWICSDIAILLYYQSTSIVDRDEVQNYYYIFINTPE